MRRIILENTPNQEFNVNLDGRRYTLKIREGRAGIMIYSIDIDGEAVVSGFRFLPNTPLLPYKYMEWGNFILTTQNGEYPDWNKFGKTQRFLYLTRAEIEALKNGV